MSIDPESPDLLFEQLAEIIRGQIEDGAIPPRRKLPTQETLAETYGLSRGTVLRATNILVDEGLVFWVKGRGLFTADADVINAWKKRRAKAR